MKKIFSIALVLSILAVSAFAGDPPINDPNCNYGHIPTPVYQCEPPHQRAVADDDSTFTYIKTLIGEYNPFVYLIN